MMRVGVAGTMFSCQEVDLRRFLALMVIRSTIYTDTRRASIYAQNQVTTHPKLHPKQKMQACNRVDC